MHTPMHCFPAPSSKTGRWRKPVPWSSSVLMMAEKLLPPGGLYVLQCVADNHCATCALNWTRPSLTGQSVTLAHDGSSWTGYDWRGATRHQSRVACGSRFRRCSRRSHCVEKLRTHFFAMLIFINRLCCHSPCGLFFRFFGSERQIRN